MCVSSEILFQKSFELLKLLALRLLWLCCWNDHWNSMIYQWDTFSGSDHLGNRIPSHQLCFWLMSREFKREMLFDSVQKTKPGSDCNLEIKFTLSFSETLWMVVSFIYLSKRFSSQHATFSGFHFRSYCLWKNGGFPSSNHVLNTLNDLAQRVSSMS